MSQPTKEQLDRLPKWAQEYIQDVRNDAAIKAALRWTEMVAFDVLPPAEGVAKGWGCNVSLSYGRVEKAYSKSWSNGSGWDENRGIGNQGKRSLFSTKLKALMAMRHGMELECAKVLAAVDLQIENEKANPTTA